VAVKPQRLWPWFIRLLGQSLLPEIEQTCPTADGTNTPALLSLLARNRNSTLSRDHLLPDGSKLIRVPIASAAWLDFHPLAIVKSTVLGTEAACEHRISMRTSGRRLNICRLQIEVGTRLNLLNW